MLVSILTFLSLWACFTIAAKARDEDWLPDEPVHHRQTIQLWQFLKQLLLQPNLYNDCIKWVDRAKGVFKIENSTRVAKLWGKRKNRPAMNYDKLSRSIRQYYKKGIIKKPEITKRLVYQFCHNYLWGPQSINCVPMHNIWCASSAKHDFGCVISLIYDVNVSFLVHLTFY